MSTLDTPGPPPWCEFSSFRFLAKMACRPRTGGAPVRRRLRLVTIPYRNCAQLVRRLRQLAPSRVVARRRYPRCIGGLHIASLTRAVAYIACLVVHSTTAIAAEYSKVPARFEVVDDASGNALPARVYLRGEQGDPRHVKSLSPEGSAVKYSVTRGASSEVHTTVSGHPFGADLEPGSYTLIVERGKEYHSLRKEFKIKPGNSSFELTARLQRWTNMARRGWYSGETHTHRRLSELPNVMMAEDLNVCLPLTYWVTDSEQNPARDNRNTEPLPGARLIRLDSTHVIWPVNTEYEIFTVSGRRHTLGAIFILNHRQPLTLSVPPLGQLRDSIDRDQVLLDLDKHNWPWSMMLVPQLNVNLFELANNHVWRTDFMFRDWYPEYIGDYMDVETDANGNFTERGWIDFGFLNYYALLNCGFDLKPTGGTASGVHPVPLGFGRVYVQLKNGFRYEDWIAGLRAGRSFVTTGPMLDVQFNNQPPGARLSGNAGEQNEVRVSGTVESAESLGAIEVIVNGEVHRTLDPQPEMTANASYRFEFSTTLGIKNSCWVAVRCFEDRTDDRVRFAHTAPVHIDIPDRPLRPRKEQVAYLMQRVDDEMKRNRGVLSREAIAEFEQARDIYARLLPDALPD